MSEKPVKSMRQNNIFTAQSRDREFYIRVMIAVAACGISFGLPFALYHLLWGSLTISAILLPVVVLQIFALISLLRRGFNAFAAWTIEIGRASCRERV